MFDWFLSSAGSGGPGLEKMRAEFGQMLDAGRHIFDAAANAFLGGTDLEVIRTDLFETEKRINSAEQQVRRELVVHASVHGVIEFPACLVLMSIVKDAERVGDYAKNIFDLAELTAHPPTGEHRERLIVLKDRISKLMGAARKVFDAQDKDGAADVICEAQKAEDFCDEQIRALLQAEQDVDMPAAYVLAYRYFKRVISHTRNIASSIIQPIHKLDFPSKVK
ncbi:MAG TPA: PhoU domain-containing protein [Thermoguttaceae bacterium]|nr:PhoU domain-containing protein [Thermoguttaceae bacterium]